jgi:hypothetical protein
MGYTRISIVQLFSVLTKYFGKKHMIIRKKIVCKKKKKKFKNYDSLKKYKERIKKKLNNIKKE